MRVQLYLFNKPNYLYPHSGLKSEVDGAWTGGVCNPIRLNYKLLYSENYLKNSIRIQLNKYFDHKYKINIYWSSFVLFSSKFLVSFGVSTFVSVTSHYVFKKIWVEFSTNFLAGHLVLFLHKVKHKIVMWWSSHDVTKKVKHGNPFAACLSMKHTHFYVPEKFCH